MHRSIIERAVTRQWNRLEIVSAHVPVTVVIVVDTATSAERLTVPLGQVAHEYVLPAEAAGGSDGGCVAILTLRSRAIVRPGAHRAFAEAMATPRSASEALGPCAFLARFGVPGPGIDAWLRTRSYVLAAHPRWSTLRGTTQDPGMAWRLANHPPSSLTPWLTLSPEALGCVIGYTARCVGTLAGDSASERTPPGDLIIMQRRRDRHWGALSTSYLSDLATALGPQRFEQFWRSALDPDAALRAVAGVPLDRWTHAWGVGLVGEHRAGPGVRLIELAGALTLVGLSLGVAAWGWGRREVR
jgi:hypothetical protein